MSIIEDVTFKLQGATRAQWIAKNPILAENEPGIEEDTDSFKIGDGETVYTNLPYYLSENGVRATIQEALDLFGVAGPQGEPGEDGVDGLPGPKGDKGDKGDTGDTGLQGAQGVKGNTGDTGSQGIPGSKGDTGDTGPAGPTGRPGLGLVSAVSDNFETGSLSKWLVTQEGDGTFVNSDQARTGTRGATSTVSANTGSKANLQKLLSDSNTAVLIAGDWRVRVAGAGGSNVPFSRMFSGAQRLADLYRANSDGRLWVRMTKADGTFSFIDLGVTKALNTWTNVVWSFDTDGNLFVVIDGAIVYSSKVTDRWAATNINVAMFGAEHPVQVGTFDIDNVSVSAQSIIEQAPVVKAPQIDLFTTPGTPTWTKPAGSVRHDLILVAPGPGAGSGRRGAAGTIRAGGGGAAGGMVLRASILSSDLGDTEAVSVGAGGVGGAAVTTDDTSGNNGAAAGVTSFGTAGASTRYLTVPTASPGQGGTASTGTAGVAAAPGGSTGAAASTTGLVGITTNNSSGRGTDNTAGAGASGGGLSAANAQSAGGSGAPASSGTTLAAAAGAVGGGNGNPGSTAHPKSLLPGGGGSGGGSNLTGPGGAGGDGGFPGGGAGGGGASVNGQNSGAGGNGANGLVAVISYFS